MEEKESKQEIKSGLDMAIASLILSIVGVSFMFCSIYLGIAFGILGLGTGVYAKIKGQGTIATIAIILSLIAITIPVTSIVAGDSLFKGIFGEKYYY